MRHIKLANGDVYQVTTCGATQGMLFIVVATDEDLLDMAMVFGHPENVSTIEHWVDGTTTDHVTFEGYVNLMSAAEIQGGVQLMLKKDVV